MRKMKLDYQQTELIFKQKREAAKLKANEMKINKKPSGSQFVIALDCNIYQAVQKIGASSRGDQPQQDKTRQDMLSTHRQNKGAP